MDSRTGNARGVRAAVWGVAGGMSCVAIAVLVLGSSGQRAPDPPAPSAAPAGEVPAFEATRSGAPDPTPATTRSGSVAASRLALRGTLVATTAGASPEATLEDLESGRRFVVSIGDRALDATVVAIEPRRVRLLERGVTRELALPAVGAAAWDPSLGPSRSEAGHPVSRVGSRHPVAPEPEPSPLLDYDASLP